MNITDLDYLVVHFKGQGNAWMSYDEYMAIPGLFQARIEILTWCASEEDARAAFARLEQGWRDVTLLGNKRTGEVIEERPQSQRLAWLADVM